MLYLLIRKKGTALSRREHGLGNRAVTPALHHVSFRLENFLGQTLGQRSSPHKLLIRDIPSGQRPNKLGRKLIFRQRQGLAEIILQGFDLTYEIDAFSINSVNAG